MSKGVFVLVRSEGSLWALPNEHVRSITSTGTDRQCRIEMASMSLLADEVLRVERRLEVRPIGDAVRWALPQGCSGLALCEQGPLVVVDGHQPPSVLAFPELETFKPEDDDESS